ncbi:HEPN domain-containing protein [Sulfolobus sp. E5-1-F]|uniref:HEPN domain-containing protein n=1 Tax=Sulfolobaceae TaxID=118883 RepID=UPI001297C00A|nr:MULTISPECIES: HEPN domain-containing protein [unclassified Sulfolobus]QGA53457.1 HEPN domain-containing protein [Sulfolobus sp. E5-1-F]QGA68866.1 HEPN domain-containing protein [Sulfolobus sp. E11-6]
MNLEPLLQKANELLRASKFNFNSGFYEIAAIAAEESLYLILNATLIKLGADIPWYLDFDALFRVISRYSNNDRLAEIRIKERDSIRLLDEIKIRLGYSIPLELDGKDVEKLIMFSEKIFDLLWRNFFKG